MFPRIAFAVAVLAAAIPAAPAQYDAADDALNRSAPKLLAALKKNGASNAGVLKFLVRRGTGPARDDAGELNSALAGRLEVALIMANTDDNFGIIKAPGAALTANGNTLANHLDGPGRKAFFSHKYELAWGNEKVDASAFVTGLVTLTEDLKELSVAFQSFDKTGALTDLPGGFKLPTTPRILAEAGFSYTVAPAKVQALVAGGSSEPPSFAEQEKTIVDDVVLTAAKQPEPSRNLPPQPIAPVADCPIKLTVEYNGKPVEVRGNVVPEPTESDKVTFTIENPTKTTYGVALFVNGENVLYRERAAGWAARKWILPAGASLTVRGFQVDSKSVEAFKVLSPEESSTEYVNYGDNAGTFRMIVFRGDLTDKDPEIDRKKKYDEQTAEVVAIARGTTQVGAVKPGSLKALQSDLRGREKASEGARGLVAKGGAKENFEVTKVFFKPLPDVPVADISLRYYTPKK